MGSNSLAVGFAKEAERGVNAGQGKRTSTWFVDHFSRPLRGSARSRKGMTQDMAVGLR